MSQNPNITIKNVIENPDKPWDWSILSCNPNITIKDVIENSDKPWDWSLLSDNTFKYYSRFKCVKSIRSKYKNIDFRIYSLKHHSQKFYKWYCGEGGIGRRIDNERQLRLNK